MRVLVKKCDLVDILLGGQNFKFTVLFKMIRKYKKSIPIFVEILVFRLGY